MKLLTRHPSAFAPSTRSVIRAAVRRSVLAVSVAWIALTVPAAQAADVTVINDVLYREGAGLSDLERERCRLDFYLPSESSGYASILWLHGGGLTGGSRNSAVTQRLARRLAAAGIAVASAEYRLNPTVTYPAYIADSAAAVAWLKRNVAGHGGDPSRVFIGGHSAGAYLALMTALDDRYLAGCGLDAEALAGVVAMSGQTSTHFQVLAERKFEGAGIVVDEAAPLFHVRKRNFPFMILYAGDDMPMRLEENRLLVSALRHAGCVDVREHFFKDRDHGTIVSRMGQPEDAVAGAVIAFIQTRAQAATAAPAAITAATTTP